MAKVKKPWIAFKVLAAGSILPRSGFAHALDNGADFLGVGMFDFQIQENCEAFNRLARRAKGRSRPWYG
jgi:NAD(P)H-dependent flavin oxidoreductase YrpB (nitropropane dioxygenase family)